MIQKRKTIPNDNEKLSDTRRNKNDESNMFDMMLPNDVKKEDILFRFDSGQSIARISVLVSRDAKGGHFGYLGLYSRHSSHIIRYPWERQAIDAARECVIQIQSGETFPDVVDFAMQRAEDDIYFEYK